MLNDYANVDNFVRGALAELLDGINLVISSFGHFVDCKGIIRYHTLLNIISEYFRWKV